MTFDAREKSTYGGDPREFYHWALGLQTWLQISGDTSEVLVGQTYDPYPLTRAEVDQNGESASGNITVTLDLQNPVAQLFLAGPPSQPLSLIITCGHEGEAETVCVFTGRVMSAKLGETCEFTCAPRQAVWKQQVPALNYQSQCPLRVFTARCGADKPSRRVPATLSSVSGLSVVAAVFAGQADGYFNGGWLEAPSGDFRKITNHVGNALTLVAALPGLAAGDVVSVYPGCQGTEADCSGRYGNLLNHLGYARIPSRQPFDSGGI